MNRNYKRFWKMFGILFLFLLIWMLPNAETLYLENVYPNFLNATFSLLFIVLFSSLTLLATNWITNIEIEIVQINDVEYPRMWLLDIFLSAIMEEIFFVFLLYEYIFRYSCHFTYFADLFVGILFVIWHIPRRKDWFSITHLSSFFIFLVIILLLRLLLNFGYLQLGLLWIIFFHFGFALILQYASIKQK